MHAMTVSSILEERSKATSNFQRRMSKMLCSSKVADDFAKLLSVREDVESPRVNVVDISMMLSDRVFSIIHFIMQEVPSMHLVRKTKFKWELKIDE